MCGIFGYIGNRKQAGPLVLAGLKTLEYRGYDSWGIAWLDNGSIKVIKKVGKIGLAAPKFPPSFLALGQTRWATHGGVTVANAHPHFDCHRRVAIVHNGIVENYQEITKSFKKTHLIRSQTDTEIISHLIEEELVIRNNFTVAVRAAFLRLKGLNAVVALDKDNRQLVAVKNGSPLAVGLGKEENYLASDALGIAEHTKKIIYLGDNELAEISGKRVSLYDVKTGKPKKIKISKIDWQQKDEGLGKYPHYLIKEVYDQPRVLARINKEAGGDISYLSRLIARSFGTYLIGCGSAAYAALTGTYFFSEIAKKHVNFSIGSEFTFQEHFITPKSLIIALSQSGETADILEAVKKAKARGGKIGALVNVPGSSLFRLADYKILIGAGQEHAVLSTKAFTGQIALLLLTAYSLAGQAESGRKVLARAVRSLKIVLNNHTQRRVKKLAVMLKNKDHVYVIGRGVSYPAALEGALKIKEDSYIHAEGFAAGELKHGVIALIESGTPCFVIAPPDETFPAALAGAMEMKARGGIIIGLAARNNEIFDYFIEVPDCGQASIIPNVAVFQTLSYYLAVLRGADPDKPRNLAKSVTVK
ncbi:MAG: glutamine--fructose-6-phosphate transaminase (isomerizing) [Patescibacteria group bacterium]